MRKAEVDGQVGYYDEETEDFYPEGALKKAEVDGKTGMYNPETEDFYPMEFAATAQPDPKPTRWQDTFTSAIKETFKPEIDLVRSAMSRPAEYAGPNQPVPEYAGPKNQSVLQGATTGGKGLIPELASRFTPDEFADAAMNAPADLAKSIPAAGADIGRGLSGVAKAVTDVTGDPGGVVNEATDFWEREQKATTPEDPSMAFKVGRNVFAQAPLIAASIPTGGSALALGGMSVTSFGNRYDELRKKNYTPAAAFTLSLPEAAAEVIGEKYGLDILVKPAMSYGVRALTATAVDVLGEEVTLGLQSALAKVSDRPNMTVADFLAEAWETAKVSAVSGPAMAGVAQLAHSAQGTGKTPPPPPAPRNLDEYIEQNSQRKPVTPAPVAAPVPGQPNAQPVAGDPLKTAPGEDALLSDISALTDEYSATGGGAREFLADKVAKSGGLERDVVIEQEQKRERTLSARLRDSLSEGDNLIVTDRNGNKSQYYVMKNSSGRMEAVGDSAGDSMGLEPDSSVPFLPRVARNGAKLSIVKKGKSPVQNEPAAPLRRGTDIDLDQFKESLRASGVDPDAPQFKPVIDQYLAHLKPRSTDALTGYQSRVEWERAMPAIGERAAAGENVSYTEIDLPGTKAGNAELGRPGVDRHLAQKFAILEGTVKKYIPDAQFFRHGGDEAQVVSTAKKETQELALAEAEKRLAAYDKANGLDKYYNHGVGLYHATETMGDHPSWEDAVELANTRIEENKKRAKGVQDGRSETEIHGLGSPEGRPAEAPGGPVKEAAGVGTVEKGTPQQQKEVDPWAEGDLRAVAPLPAEDIPYLEDLRSMINTMDAPGKKAGGKDAEVKVVRTVSGLPGHLVGTGLLKTDAAVLDKYLAGQPITKNQYKKLAKAVKTHKEGIGHGENVTSIETEMVPGNSLHAGDVFYQGGSYRKVVDETPWENTITVDDGSGSTMTFATTEEIQLDKGSIEKAQPKREAWEVPFDEAGGVAEKPNVRYTGKHELSNAGREDLPGRQGNAEAGRVSDAGGSPTAGVKNYFIPLVSEYYEKIKSGEQDSEIRPLNHHGWNTKNIYTGRAVTFSKGYGTQDRTAKAITKSVVTDNLADVGIPQWHIDAVEKIYGKQDKWLVAFVGSPANPAAGEFQLTPQESTVRKPAPKQQGLTLGMTGKDLRAPERQNSPLTETPLEKSARESKARADQPGLFDELKKSESGIQQIGKPKVEVVSEVIGHYESNVTQISGPADVAQMVQEIGRSPQEKLVMVIADGDGRAISILNYSMGSHNSSIVHPMAMGRVLQVPGAKQVWFAHNHPSGDTKPSPEDIALTKRLKSILDKTPVKYEGHIIIGDGVWSDLMFLGGELHVGTGSIPADRVAESHKIPIIERRFKSRGSGQEISGGAEFREFGEKELPDGGIVLMDTKNRVISLLTLPESLDGMQGPIHTSLLQEIEKANASSMLVYSPKRSFSKEEASSLGSFSSLAGVKLLDISEGKGLGWRDSGRMDGIAETSNTPYSGVSDKVLSGLLLKADPNSRAAFARVFELGKRVYESGKTSYAEFEFAVHKRMGAAWGKLKGMVKKAWNRLKAINEKMGQTGGNSEYVKSNLNPFQRKQVASPEFKAWFKGSKVVDENGDPLVVYHGQGREFTEFQEGQKNGWSKPRKGFYFTDRKEAAKEFAGTGVEPIAAYLSMQKPADLRYSGTPGSKTLQSIVGEMDAETTSQYEDQSIGRLSADGMFQTEQFLDAAKKAGFDGIIIEDALGKGMYFDSYIALKNTQIKSATGNTGAFNPNDASIVAEEKAKYGEPAKKITLTEWMKAVEGAVAAGKNVPKSVIDDYLKRGGTNKEIINSKGAEIAKSLDLIYNGIQETVDGKPDLVLFTDKETKGTMSVKVAAASPEAVKARLEEMRANFKKVPRGGNVENAGDVPPPTKYIPVTTEKSPDSDTKESKLAKRAESDAIKEKLTEDFGDLAEYRTMNMQEQADKAQTIMAADYEAAKRMAMGEELPPQGVREATMYEAVKIRALKEGDTVTLYNLAVNSTVPTRLSEYGQAIKAADSRLMDDPVKVMQEVIRGREERAKRTGKDPVSIAKIEALTKELNEVTERLRAHEEAASKKQAKSVEQEIKKQVFREAKRASRSASKSVLDEEFSGLARQLRGILKPGTLNMSIGAIDPSAIPVLVAMAKNRIKSGMLHIEGVVDSIYTEVKSILPDITKRNVRDAISGYGKQAKMSKEEIDVRLRELKRQARLISALEDAKAGQSPLKSGLTRDEVTDEVRALTKEVKQAMRDSGIDSETTRSPEQQYKSALDAVKTRLRNQIHDINKQLETGQKTPKNKGIEYDAEANALKAERDKVRAMLRDVEGKPEMSPEQRVRVAMAAVERSIAELERRIAEHDLVRAKKESKTPVTPELSRLRSLRDGLKVQFKEMQDAAKAPKDPAAIRLKAFKTRTANEIARLEKKLADGDFVKVEKAPPAELDEEGKKLKAAREIAKENYHAAMDASRTVTKEEAAEIVRLSKVTEDARKAMEQGGDRLEYGAARVAYENYVNDLKRTNAPIKELIKDRIGEFKTTWKENKARAAWELQKDTIKTITDNSIAMVASLDNSFLGRQGLKTLMTHPAAWWPGAKNSFIDFAKTLGGKETMDALNADIYSRPNYVNGEYLKAKIITKTEEQYPDTLPERIPGAGRIFKASEVAFTGSALRMRTDLYDMLSAKAKENGAKMNKEQIEDIGKLINSLTARGKWGDRGDQPIVRLILWAPKMLKGNIDVLTAHNFGAGLETGFARKEAALNLLKIVSITAVLMAIANALKPDSAELDPRSSDFGKIKVGTTRFDITGGAASIVVLAARIIPGLWGNAASKSTTTGLVTPYGIGYGKRSPFDALIDFVNNKTTPAAGVVSSWLKGKNRDNEAWTVGDAAYRAFTPISMQNMIKLKDDVSADKIAGALVDFIGINSNSYGDSSAQRGDIVDKMRAGKPLNKKQREAFDAMSKTQQKNIEKESELTAIQAGIKKLPIEDALYAWAEASEKDKDKIRATLIKKIKNSKKSSEEKDAYFAKMGIKNIDEYDEMDEYDEEEEE